MSSGFLVPDNLTDDESLRAFLVLLSERVDTLTNELAQANKQLADLLAAGTQP